MADEEKNEKQNEEQPEAPEGEAPAEDAPAEEQAPEAPAEDAPAEEQAPDAPAEDEAPAEEQAPAEEPAAEEPAAEEPAGPDAGADEMEGLDWKARRRLERSRASGEAQPQRSPEERLTEREQRRRAARARRSAYRRRAREGRKGGTGTEPAERASVARKVRQGTVVSSKADKTITVRIDIVRRHPTYEKIVRRSSTLHAHDEGNEANEGDVVRLVETRPISRTKRWRLAEILERAR